MKVLIDTNVMLDFLSQRPPFYESANQIIQLCAEERIQGFIAAHSVLNAFYILRKAYSENDRKRILLQFLDLVTIIDIGNENIRECLKNEKFKDLEDCLQESCASRCQADYIITRDIEGFSVSDVSVLSPTQFLEVLNLQSSTDTDGTTKE